MASDRIFGLVMLIVALAAIAGATQFDTPFLSDPVGGKTFPVLIAGLTAICAAWMIWKPDADPDWPRGGALLRIAAATAVMVGYAYSLKPLGFLIPTAVAAGALSWMIRPNLPRAVLAGLGLSGGLFVIFKFGLKLGLVALPKFATGG
jgi:putative tricarboxylic transport membrane protein